MERWVPEIQTAVGSTAAAGAVYVPPADPTFTRLHDALKNKGDTPLHVRALTIDAGAPAVGPFPLRVKIARGRGDVDLGVQGALQKAYFPNCVSSRLGSLAAGYEYLWKLWKPYLLRAGQSLEVTVGGVPNQTTYVFSGNVSDTFFHGIAARGVKTGRVYRFGGTGAAVSSYFKAHQNDFEEDLLITSISVVGTVTNPYPIIKIASPEWSWMPRERPFWLWSDPFLQSRFVFDFLPGGALVLEPGEGITIDGDVSGVLTVKAALEAYRRLS